MRLLSCQPTQRLLFTHFLFLENQTAYYDDFVYSSKQGPDVLELEVDKETIIRLDGFKTPLFQNQTVSNIFIQLPLYSIYNYSVLVVLDF